MHEHLLIGRIADLTIFSVPEFGTRASFKLECSGQCAVAFALPETSLVNS